jgi:hypothetical protein
MVMTVQQIKSVFFWITIFTFATRFIYTVTIFSIAASLVFWEWYTSWWIIGSAAGAYLLTFYLEFIIYNHNMRVLEIIKRLQEEIDRKERK